MERNYVSKSLKWSVPLPSIAELRQLSVETLSPFSFLNVYIELIKHSFLSPQVDASAGKDKLSAKVTSGITDLLGKLILALSSLYSHIPAHRSAQVGWFCVSWIHPR